MQKNDAIRTDAFIRAFNSELQGVVKRYLSEAVDIRIMTPMALAGMNAGLVVALSRVHTISRVDDACMLQAVVDSIAEFRNDVEQPLNKTDGGHADKTTH